MKIYHHVINQLNNQRGVTAVVVAIVISTLMGFVALAVDIGYVAATKNELQNIADAAALAGAGELGDQYVNKETIDDDAIKDIAVEVGNKSKAGGEHITVVRDEIEIGTFDNSRNPKFVPNVTDPFVPDGDENAVRVITRRDAVANGPITTFFAKIFGRNTVDVKADATAALTDIAGISPGEMNMPIGLSENWFIPEPDCESTIKFSPTTSSCAGWHNFFDDINADAMKDKLLGFILDDPTEHDEPDLPYGECVLEPCGRVDPNNTTDVSWVDEKFDMIPSGVRDRLVPKYTPGAQTGESFFEFQGGKIAALLEGPKLVWEDDAGYGTNYTVPVYNTPGDPDSGQEVLVDEKEDNERPAAFFAAFDYFRFRDEIPIPENGVSFDTDGDGINDLTVTDPDAVWSGTIPIYEDEDSCINPQGSIKIVGFAIIHVVRPNPPPDTTILAKIACELNIIGGKGGGSTTGYLKGDIPLLVE